MLQYTAWTKGALLKTCMYNCVRLQNACCIWTWFLSNRGLRLTGEPSVPWHSGRSGNWCWHSSASTGMKDAGCIASRPLSRTATEPIARRQKGGSSLCLTESIIPSRAVRDTSLSPYGQASARTTPGEHIVYRH
ncbi:hypothetical protein DPEC_G00084470 [Dallia pectoralis]|uniref:Uncharacterized protein n=1 Tax=Dallia pectoralis TaxID=75939 RepID=A0ACC2GZB3_DALPE|nr:hypothetical protein DPEC_G00084470 [Dallia pectoralis]